MWLAYPHGSCGMFLGVWGLSQASSLPTGLNCPHGVYDPSAKSIKLHKSNHWLGVLTDVKRPGDTQPVICVRRISFRNKSSDKLAEVEV